MQRRGQYPPPPGAPQDVPGLEVAGEVVALGPGRRSLCVGDQVCALLPGAGYAEYAKVHETNALPVPKGFSMVEAAAIPETYFTIWPSIIERGRLAPGDTDPHPWRLVRHRHKRNPARQGLWRPSDRDRRDRRRSARPAASSAPTSRSTTEPRISSTAVKNATGGVGANVILDMVGGDYVNRNYEAAADDARIVQIAVQKGAHAEVDIRRLMVKRLIHTGSTLRPRSVAFKASVAAHARGEGLAALRGPDDLARDRLDLSPRPGRRRPCPDGRRRPYRPHRADRRPSQRLGPHRRPVRLNCIAESKRLYRRHPHQFD